MLGYYVTDIDGKAILDYTIFLDRDDVARMNKYYNTRGIKTNIKTILVQGTQLVLDRVIDSSIYEKDPEAVDNYVKQSMTYELADKLDIKYERAPELDLHIGSHVDYHFKGRIELPPEYIKNL